MAWFSASVTDGAVGRRAAILATIGWRCAGALALMLLWTAPMGLQAAGKAASGPAPAYDPKDLTGFWVSTEGPFTNTESFARAVRLMRPDLKDYPVTNPDDYPNRHPPLPIRYTPEFEALHKKIKAEYDAGRPYRTGYMCQPNGLLFAAIANQPFEILAAPGRLLFMRENVGTVWHVYLNRPLKTEFLNPELFGDSVGHWEGNTLVVESTNLGGHAVVVETEPYSQSLRVVQRIRRPTYDTLVIDILAEDNRAFLEPLKFHVTYGLDNSLELDESQCWDDGGGKRMEMAPE